MKRISIGSWAYTIGPYENNPVDFDTVCTKLVELALTASSWAASPRTRTRMTQTKRVARRSSRR